MKCNFLYKEQNESFLHVMKVCSKWKYKDVILQVFRWFPWHPEWKVAFPESVLSSTASRR